MEKLTGIIMAAGMGVRLKEVTKDIPKAMIKVADKPLIWYAINFMKKVGADKIIVIGGYHYNKLKKVVQEIDSKIDIYENKNFENGNMFSLGIALRYINESFLLTHVDHIFSENIAKKVNEQLGNEIIIFTDHDRQLTEDDMKVAADKEGKFLKKVSKNMTNSGLGYVGLTYCPFDHLAYYRQAVDHSLKNIGDKSVTEDAMQYIADEDAVEISIGDISGDRWFEIDFPEEFERASEQIKKNINLYN